MYEGSCSGSGDVLSVVVGESVFSQAVDDRRSEAPFAVVGAVVVRRSEAPVVVEDQRIELTGEDVLLAVLYRKGKRALYIRLLSAPD